MQSAESAIQLNSRYVEIMAELFLAMKVNGKSNVPSNVIEAIYRALEDVVGATARNLVSKRKGAEWLAGLTCCLSLATGKEQDAIEMKASIERFIGICDRFPDGFLTDPIYMMGYENVEPGGFRAFVDYLIRKNNLS